MASDAPTAEKPPASPGPAPRAGGGGRQVLLDRFVIHPDQPYADLSTPATPAVLAEDPMAAGEPRAAIICDVDPLPRMEVMEKLKGLARPGLTQISAFGPIDWPG